MYFIHVYIHAWFDATCDFTSAVCLSHACYACYVHTCDKSVPFKLWVILTVDIDNIKKLQQIIIPIHLYGGVPHSFWNITTYIDITTNQIVKLLALSKVELADNLST